MAPRILVPVDESDNARDAFEFAATTWPDARLVVLHVVDPFDVTGDLEGASVTGDALKARGEQATTFLESYEERDEDHTGDVETEVRYGDPSRAILGAVDDFGIDHVVMGSAGKSGMGRVLMGSVAETVSKRCPVSVTIVRPSKMGETASG